MISFNIVHAVSLPNVNTGIITVEEGKYIVNIPMYPKFKNENIIKIYSELNAPLDFYDNLKKKLKDNKEIKFYKSEITELPFSKKEAKYKLIDQGINVNYPEVYSFFLDNDLKETIKFMTDLKDNNLPMFKTQVYF